LSFSLRGFSIMFSFMYHELRPMRSPPNALRQRARATALAIS
jgi:hypothetical protein